MYENQVWRQTAAERNCRGSLDLSMVISYDTDWSMFKEDKCLG